MSAQCVDERMITVHYYSISSIARMSPVTTRGQCGLVLRRLVMGRVGCIGKGGKSKSL